MEPPSGSRRRDKWKTKLGFTRVSKASSTSNVVNPTGAGPDSLEVCEASVFDAESTPSQAPQKYLASCESLWDLAFEDLRRREKNLVDAFEKILMAESEVETNLHNGDTSKREKQMSAFVAKKLDAMNKEQWRFTIGGMSVDVREQVDQIVKIVLIAKEFISPVACVDPIHTGLPWAGVCMLLPLLVNDSKQRAAAIDGLGYISTLVRRYTEIEHIYFQAEQVTLREDLETAITSLYSQILEYEARAACQFNRNIAIQIARNIVEADNWQTILRDIKLSETACDRLLAVIDAQDQRARTKRLQSVLDEQNRKIDELLKASRKLDEEYEKLLLAEMKAGREEQRNRHLTDEKRKCLQTLRTSTYEEHKARNPNRVPETCQWFLKNEKFHSWRNNKTSGLLWVSADPGCGKSVLSKSLIDQELLITDSCTTCYFFFKDDNDDQKSAAKALCALLHQLFSRKTSLLDHALKDFEENGSSLSQLFSVLWKILTEAASNPEAGEIICVLDALDECEESGKKSLIGSLNTFYRGSKSRDTRLKFLVTSRPYYDIERLFDDQTIRLAGEDESELIRHEIDIVIKEDTVPKIASSLKLDPDARAFLQEHLLNVTNRTYLWLRLIRDHIMQNLGVNTRRKVEKVANEMPSTINEAYEAILNRSPHPEQAKKLLHIIVAAVRPLTLKETNVALNIEEGQSRYEDVDLDPEDIFRSKVKNLCGLFVSVIDSKVYLIHQTAKEFLVVPKKDSCPMVWKHSLRLQDSNLVLAEICISYLLFAEFEMRPLVINPEVKKREEIVDQYSNKYDFLDYAAKHWALHFREARINEGALLMSTFDICDAKSKRFLTWFQVYCTTSVLLSRCPQNFTNLMVGSYFGHEIVVKLLLDKDANVNAEDSDGRTALYLAASCGYTAIIQLLLDKGANFDTPTNYGRTVLHQAALKGHTEAVQLLLDKGANIDTTDSKGRTALHQAALRGHTETIQLLLNKGANIDTTDSSGRTELHQATLRGHIETVQLLLNKGANVDTADSKGWTALHQAALRGHTEAVQLLLDKGANIDTADSNGPTALHQAALRGHIETVQLLLDKGANIDTADLNGRTALHLAASRGHIDIVQLLLDRGANIDTAGSKGWTALHQAASVGQTETIQLLLEMGANIDAADSSGRTALHQAALDGHAEAVQLLLDNGANIDTTYSSGWTALHQAALRGHTETIQLLLDKGANIDTTDSNGRTALHLAASRGHIDIIQLLLDKGANVDIADSKGWIALHQAASVGQTETIQLLLDKGANINTADSKGWTALHQAASISQAETIQLLLNKGANIDTADSNGRTALRQAALGGHTENVQLLLDNGANIDTADSSGWTALHLVAMRGNTETVQLLLDKGANTNTADSNGRTALHLAASNGHTETVQLLLDKGANSNTTDSKGRTALHLAASNGRTDIFQLLLGKGSNVNADSDGRAAPDEATSNSHTDIVQFLKVTEIH